MPRQCEHWLAMTFIGADDSVGPNDDRTISDRADRVVRPYGALSYPFVGRDDPVAVPKILLRHLGRQNFDRCHSLTSLYLPLAALGSFPTSRRRTAIHFLPPHRISGSGARRTDDASYATISTVFRERVEQGRKFAMQNSVRGFLNRRFKQRFWVLLPLRAKVPRARKSETPLYK